VAASLNRDVRAPSVAERIFLVLEACASSNRTLTLSEFVQRTGLPKTTLHRTCWKLVELGALDYVGGGYCIGTKLFALGGLNPCLRRLRAAAMPYLHELCLATGGVSDLAVLSDGQALIIEEVYPPSSRVPRMLGSPLPAHCTAVGKALIAALEPEERELLLDGPLSPATWRTLVQPAMLREHLDRIAQTGLACSHEEWRLGVCGVAAPVFAAGRVLAAIGWVGPPEANLLRRVGDPVRRAGRMVTEALAAESLPQPASA
jgi:DNA-binding IclR family transcriptional regulator